MPAIRVLAGSSVDSLESITSLVNANIPFHVQSEIFEGQIVVNIKGFAGDKGCEYFKRPDRQGITWSIQVQGHHFLEHPMPSLKRTTGRFLKRYSANDVLFGNTFDRPLNLPWGSGAALKFMNYIDPVLEHDLTSSTKPWALSPLVATMPHFTHTQGEPSTFPPSASLLDDTKDLYLALVNPSPASSTSNASNSSTLHSSRKKLREAHQNLALSNVRTSSQRRSFFASEENRNSIAFGPQDVVTTDFCYGFLEFNPSLALRIPGGISFDLMRYWDGQPVRFVCCERGFGGKEPFGRVFWCLSIEADDSKGDLKVAESLSTPSEEDKDIGPENIA